MSILILFLYILVSSFTVCNAKTSRFLTTNLPSKDNPFTAKDSLIRYWNNNLPKHPPPSFLLSKSSPLTAVESAMFTKLATQNALSAHLDSFCSSANLYCLFDDSSSSSLTSNGANDTIKGSLGFNKKYTQKHYNVNLGSNKKYIQKHYNVSLGSNKKYIQKHYNGSFVNERIEPGNFFRESMLKEGNVMIMPDLRIKMPERSFLPRSISSELPFSTSKLAELKDIFHARDNSNTEHVIINALTECESAPSIGETKRCVGTVEDMLDFAISVLGRNIMVRNTKNVNGSKKNVMIGEVKGINGGKVTKSVSCHQSLYPYQLYYCHSVPKVRVYEVDILDVESKVEINHGVAICHIDTSAWSQEHGAFEELGSSPGRIEVCHWIYENDMTWTIDD